LNFLLIHNDTGTPPHGDTPNEYSIDPHQSDLGFASDQTITVDYGKVVTVESLGPNVYSKATELYDMHYKYLELWSLWHPCWLQGDIQYTQLCSQYVKPRIDQHLQHWLNIFNIDLFQLPSAPRMLLSVLYFGLTMTVEVKIIHICSVHYGSGIFSNPYSVIWNIFQFRHTSVLNLCTLPKLKKLNLQSHK
jgi:hypothetical protein